MMRKYLLKKQKELSNFKNLIALNSYYNPNRTATLFPHRGAVDRSYGTFLCPKIGGKDMSNSSLLIPRVTTRLINS